MQESSPAIQIFFSELLRQKRLAVSVVIVTVVHSGLVFGLSPYLVSLFAEKVATDSSAESFRKLVIAVAIVAAADAVLFLLRIRWRRQLSARGRTGLSERLNDAIGNTDHTTSRQATEQNAETQKMQDAWVDLVLNVTEMFIPFVCGSLSLILIVAVQAPLFVIPILVLVAGGVAVAIVSSRNFNASTHVLQAAAARERTVFDAMFAVPRMKWLVAKLTPIRSEASDEYESQFYQQAIAFSRWQGLLLLVGNILKVAAVASAPLLMSMGYSSSVAVLIVLLGYALGDKFLSITNILCSYDWILFRADSVSSFVKNVEGSATMPLLPDDAFQSGTTYVFRGVAGVYGMGSDRHEIRLPDVTFRAGTTIVMGTSGVGKSTFFGVADGSVSYVGSVCVGGYELREWDVSRYVVNGSQSFGSMDITLAQLLGADIDEKKRDIALLCSAYPEVDLLKPLSSLSGGQRQRAVLAAIVYETLTGNVEDGVLFLDEPTTGLGATEIKRLIKGLRLLSQLLPNLAIVIATHEGKLVRLADQLIVLLGGGKARVKRRQAGKLVLSDS